MIFLVRHGLDDENYKGGWSNKGLTSDGVKQIKALASSLKGEKFACIVSSDVKRARESALILGSELGLDVIYDKRLREQSKGIISGMKREKAEELFPQLEPEVIHDNVFFPGGERIIDFCNRVKLFLPYLLTMTDNALVVTHRGYINALYHITNGETDYKHYDRYSIPHGTLHVLEKNRIYRRVS